MRPRLLCALAALIVTGLTPSASADDWPQWRGPNRDGKSAEKGLLKSWPAGGPRLLWTARGCGVGFSSPAIVGDTIYVAGYRNGKSCIMTYDLNGRPGKNIAWAPGYKQGARSTTTVHDGLLYMLSPLGDLLCADAQTLTPKWTKNILKEFGGRNITWRMSESLLVDGDNLICTPGGRDAAIVALERRTGRTVWTSKGLSDSAAYSSCVKFTAGGMPQITTVTRNGLVGVDARDGRFLWRYRRPANSTANVPTPVFEGGRVFAATGYNTGGGAVDVRARGGRVEAAQAWQTKDMVCHHGGYVLVDGFLYGNHGNGWSCVDFRTGRTRYTARGVGKGSIIYADGMLYCLGEAGTMGLVRATPQGHQVVSRFPVPNLKRQERQVWAHPAISGGRLYIRYGDYLYAYEIRNR